MNVVEAKAPHEMPLLHFLNLQLLRGPNHKLIIISQTPPPQKNTTHRKLSCSPIDVICIVFGQFGVRIVLVGVDRISHTCQDCGQNDCP